MGMGRHRGQAMDRMQLVIGHEHNAQINVKDLASILGWTAGFGSGTTNRLEVFDLALLL